MSKNNTYRVYTVIATVEGQKVNKGDFAVVLFDAEKYGIGTKGYIREHARGLFPEATAVKVQTPESGRVQVETNAQALAKAGVTVVAKPTIAKAKAVAGARSERVQGFFEHVVNADTDTPEVEVTSDVDTLIAQLKANPAETLAALLK